MTLPDATGTKKPEKKNKEMSQDREIAVFAKSAVEEVRVKIVEWKCQSYIDLRVWFNSNGNEFFPTKKGITIDIELLPRLIDALEKADKALKETGGKK